MEIVCCEQTPPPTIADETTNYTDISAINLLRFMLLIIREIFTHNDNNTNHTDHTNDTHHTHHTHHTNHTNHADQTRHTIDDEDDWLNLEIGKFFAYGAVRV